MKQEPIITPENLEEVIASHIIGENVNITFYANILYGAPGEESDDNYSEEAYREYETAYTLHIQLRDLLYGYQDILKVHEILERGTLITPKCACCGYEHCFTREVIVKRLKGEGA